MHVHNKRSNLSDLLSRRLMDFLMVPLGFMILSLWLPVHSIYQSLGSGVPTGRKQKGSSDGVENFDKYN
uniref:Ovule protein n=1 Tax=Schistosoma curassoni TaxID=6186 RepID=A0A183K3H5_9TREM